MYELWINHRAVSNGSITNPDGEYQKFQKFFQAQEPIPAIVTGTYPKPVFSKPIEFFTTRATDPNINARRGLADFTNRNFYSEGTVYSSDYTSPPSTPGGAGLTFADRPGGMVTGYGVLIVRDILWGVSDAVGRWDAPEPQFLVFHNDTDVHVSNSTWTPSTPPPGVGLEPTDNEVVGVATWNFNQQIFHLANALPAGRFIRVAVVGPQAPRQMRLQAELEFGPFVPSDVTIDSLLLYHPRQGDTETIAAGEYSPDSFLERRGTVFDLGYRIFKTDGSQRPSLSLLPPLTQQLAVPDIVVIDSALR